MANEEEIEAQFPALLAEDKERRRQMQETKRQTTERHQGTRMGSVIPDSMFRKPSGVRQTWTQKMMAQMLSHPGTWFERYYTYPTEEKAKKGGASSTMYTFNAAHENEDGLKNRAYSDFLEEHGGRFYAETTADPISPDHSINPFPGHWVHVLRVRWEKA